MNNELGEQIAKVSYITKYLDSQAQVQTLEINLMQANDYISDLKGELEDSKAKVQGERERTIKALHDYNMGKISGERCAGIIGVNTFEFMELY